jgi:hypothetical protein
LRKQQGGSDVIFDDSRNRIGGALLLAVVTLKRRESGRNYRLPEERDYAIIHAAEQAVKSLPEGSVPDEPLPLMTGTFNAPLYGIDTWGKLFTSRQKLALVTLVQLCQARANTQVKDALALAISKLSELACSICGWEPIAECPRHIFGRQAIPIAWDFAEGVITSSSSGSFEVSLDNTANGIKGVGEISVASSPQLADARESPLPDASCDVWFTDPPYYFAVPYADLSDFFFVWLKRALPTQVLLRDPFDSTNALTPKDRELCEMAHWDSQRYAHKDQAFFEDGMRKAFEEGRRILKGTGIGSVVFAHKTTEGWEALLSGMIRGGWVITGSWPIATEMASRLRARDSAALATSVHLVCRPRTEDEIGDWGTVLRQLPIRVGDRMERLQSEGVRGADLVFACIGPALEIYSRYARVVDAEEREIPLGGDPEAKEAHKRGYLAYVWEVVGRLALEQVLGTAEAKARNGASGALEEDARLTALFLWTLQSTNGKDEGTGIKDAEVQAVDAEEDEDEDDGSSKAKKKGFTLIYDVARRFAQPLGIHLEDWEGRIIETKKGIVRLLPISERATQLFGEEGADAVAHRLESDRTIAATNEWLPGFEPGVVAPKVRGRARRKRAGTSSESFNSTFTQRGATTLDRIHAAMLLQASGRANALRALLETEQERGPDFLRLANSLSALYPKESEEKRLLDAMLLAVPR